MISIWDSTNGRELLAIDDLPGEPISGEFTSDGRSLVAAFGNRQIKVWKSMSPSEYIAVDQEERLQVARIEEQRVRPERSRTSDAVKPRVTVPERLAGTVDKWLVLLPIRLSDDNASANEALVQGLANSLIGEEQLSAGTVRLPQENQRIQVGGRELTWRAAHPEDNVLDFGSLLGEGTWWDNCLAYAVCYVNSPSEQSCQLNLSLDDGVKIYLNGEVVFPSDAGESANAPTTPANESHSSIELRQGRNILLVKSVNTIGPWFTKVRFANHSNDPITGLTFSLDPD